MQISAATLLTAQQAKPQAQAARFEPPDFSDVLNEAAPSAPQPAPAASGPNAPAAPRAGLGSLLDIRV